ncbi:hypothetical protein [Lysobacter tyrosinilyticus]
MNQAPSIDDLMSAYAEDAVDYCREKFSIVLDYSDESVEKVETVLASLHEQLPRGFMAKLFRTGPSPQVIDQLAKMLGAYVGEVMRRNWGGHWKIGSDAFPGEMMCTLELPGASDVWPHVKVGKRIVNGPEDNVRHYFRVLKQSFHCELARTRD